MTGHTKSRVLIVGAGRGIGLELAEQYAAAGWEVHATTRTPEQPGPLGEASGAVHLHLLDVRDRGQISTVADAVSDLDVFIHNAGVGRGTPRAEMMAVNAEAPIHMTEDLLTARAIKPGGKVVLVTSQLGSRRGRRGKLGDYGDSKAALNDEFRRRAPEWAGHRVVAIVLHPGWVRTDMGGPSATLSVQESVTGIRDVVAGMSPVDHGRFLTWDGREHPW
jgi:NAD(P)-dependent dehydrogenase (short-subunit alcohol dehydrogenase family)